MPRFTFVVSLLTFRVLFGQTVPVDPQNPSPNSVVQLKRTQAAPASTPQKTDTFVDHFDFGANVRALAQSMETPVTTGAIPPPTRGPSAVPEGYRPATDVALSPTAQQAVEFSASWRAQQNGPAPGPDGRVLYAFDASNLANQLYASSTNSTRDQPAPPVKMTVPTIANGRVYVGGQNAVSVYGLLQ